MKAGLVAFLAGLLFALGLGIGGMTQPAKVVGFLDVTGSWDPSLAFVMGGAIAVHALGHALIRRRSAPVLAPAFRIPARSGVDGRLLGGAALFGLGWGLAGYCPGPGLVAIGSGATSALVFVLAMAVGMTLQHALDGALGRRPAVGEEPAGG